MSPRDALALLVLDYRFRWGSAPDSAAWHKAMLDAGCPEPVPVNVEAWLWETASAALADTPRGDARGA